MESLGGLRGRFLLQHLIQVQAVTPAKRQAQRSRENFEESHSGILPMNPSNNDKTSSAESGEERPVIKENAGQPSTYPTQNWKGVSQGLAGVRKEAIEHKEMKFTRL